MNITQGRLRTARCLVMELAGAVGRCCVHVFECVLGGLACRCVAATDLPPSCLTLRWVVQAVLGFSNLDVFLGRPEKLWSTVGMGQVQVLLPVCDGVRVAELSGLQCSRLCFDNCSVLTPTEEWLPEPIPGKSESIKAHL